MREYKYLISNTALFTISRVSSKLVMFILMPLYTGILTTSEYGFIDLIVTSIDILIPILTLGIAESTLRFAIDNNSDKKQVLNISLLMLLIGMIITSVLYTIIPKNSMINTYALLIFMVIFTSILHIILSQFIRGIERVKLYAIDGILCSFLLAISNIVCLVYLKLGIEGYLLSIVISQLISGLFLIIVGKIYRYIEPRKIDLKLMKNMIRYSLPLVPNALSWWIINTSSRYIITFFCGIGATGLYSAAYKLPAILNTFIDIFMKAWRISAIKEAENTTIFYSNIFKCYFIFTSITTSLILIVIRLIARILYSNEFYNAWIYVPFLLLSAFFMGLSSYFGVIYNVKYKTKAVLLTTALGAIINLILTVIFVRSIGVLGATLGAMIANLIVWIYRVIDTKKYIDIKIDWRNVIVTIAILLIQSILLVLNVEISCTVIGGLSLILIVINFKEVFSIGINGRKIMISNKLYRR